MSDKWVVGGVTQRVILTPAVSASPGRASEMHFSGPIPIPDLLKQNLGGLGETREQQSISSPGHSDAS